MNILDENVPEDQWRLLRSWRVTARQIGYDVGRSGMQDDEIVSLLHAYRRTTFFTLDRDFAHPRLCHPSYCIVYLDVRRSVAADYARRVLRHPELNTRAKRMGAVIRASYVGLGVWRRNAAERALPWPER